LRAIESRSAGAHLLRGLLEKPRVLLVLGERAEVVIDRRIHPSGFLARGDFVAIARAILLIEFAVLLVIAERRRRHADDCGRAATGEGGQILGLDARGLRRREDALVEHLRME